MKGSTRHFLDSRPSDNGKSKMIGRGYRMNASPNLLHKPMFEPGQIPSSNQSSHAGSSRDRWSRTDGRKLSAIAGLL